MTRFFRNLMLATTALLPLGIGFALAGPMGGTVVGGGATIDGQGSGRVTINQHTRKAKSDKAPRPLCGGPQS